MTGLDYCPFKLIFFAGSVNSIMSMSSMRGSLSRIFLFLAKVFSQQRMGAGEESLDDKEDLSLARK